MSSAIISEEHSTTNIEQGRFSFKMKKTNVNNLPFQNIWVMQGTCDDGLSPNRKYGKLMKRYKRWNLTSIEYLNRSITLFKFKHFYDQMEFDLY